MTYTEAVKLALEFHKSIGDKYTIDMVVATANRILREANSEYTKKHG